MRKNIVILGSTGSIGENALEVVRQFPDNFRVVGLSGNANIDRLASQAKEFKPEVVAIGDKSCAAKANSRFSKKTKIFVGRDGISALASLKNIDLVLVAIVGSEAIWPVLSAIRAKKTIALANKESIVMAGPLLLKEARRFGATIVPIDSEQSAIFQCLQGQVRKSVGCVYLTASGGALRDYSKDRIEKVTVKEVLAHPRWKMGRKITVDSATMMNKGLEVLEAQQLFDLELEQIKVLIHRQAIIHSMVEFQDGSMLAQLGITDMRLPIQYALSFPERLTNQRLRLDPFLMGDLTFSKPDNKKFPCLKLAYDAGRIGGVAPCVLNAANEVAVDAFLKGVLRFSKISNVIEEVLEKTPRLNTTLTLDKIFSADAQARVDAKELVDKYAKRLR